MAIVNLAATIISFGVNMRVVVSAEHCSVCDKRLQCLEITSLAYVDRWYVSRNGYQPIQHVF